MNDRHTFGIFREAAHSPGREADDGEILRLTAKALEGRGFQVTLKDPGELTGTPVGRPAHVFAMCERLDALAVLHDWEQAGTCVVNTPRAVRNTYRLEMLACWRRAKIPFPRTRVVSTHGPLPPGNRRGWVKRGDVHNTQAGDVVFAEGPTSMRRALQGLFGRGITRAIVQEHLEGDLIKFYGIGRAEGRPARVEWFRWFYHAHAPVNGYRFQASRLADLAWRAAGALGLEVFGGDVLVSSRGALRLIDLNAWPSFALYRDEAAARIAAYLEARFRDADISRPARRQRW